MIRRKERIAKALVIDINPKYEGLELPEDQPKASGSIILKSAADALDFLTSVLSYDPQAERFY